MAPTMWDMHVHLDFMRDMAAVAAEARGRGLGLFAVTVTPQGFRTARAELSGSPNVRVGVGLHPWWVADGRCGQPDIELAAQLVRETRFVGEIGLDLSPKHVPEGTIEAQVNALEMVCRACAETSAADAPKVLSLHSVRAAGLTLDVLGRTGCLGTCSCVFHWFTGTSDELHRAVKAGCWFSINEMMLATRRGREYARQLPQERLLLETDLPPGEDVPFSADEICASLARTTAQLAEIRHADIGAVLRANSEALLSGSI